MGDALTLKRIQQAVVDLYDSYDVLTDDIKVFIERTIQNGGYEEAYARVRQAEAENRENPIEYQEKKTGVINSKNIHDVLVALKKKKDSK